MNSLTIKNPVNMTSYDVTVGNGLIDEIGDLASQFMTDATRIGVVSDRTVFGLYGDRIRIGLGSANPPLVHLIREGESRKNLKAVERLIAFLQDSQIKRQDILIAFGGGIVGDVAGFAASIYRRGMPVIQVPTTLLAMIDSSVGGKTGVNFGNAKNAIGTFHDPSAVVIDPTVLATLDARQINAGLYEAVKHGVLSGKRLFGQTEKLIECVRAGVVHDSDLDLSKALTSQVAFKASIVSGDPNETSGKNRATSRKILNFGHTFGHAIESATGFDRLLHGEAVGYGMLIAADLSKNLALFDQTELNLLRIVVRTIGPLPSIADIDAADVFDRLHFDKKSSDGDVELVLLKGIGKPTVVPMSTVPKKAIISSIGRIIKNSA